MTTVLIISIYLIGYVVAYLSIRRYITGGNMSIWTISDRRYALRGSFFSWLFAIVAWICILIEKSEENKDKPAKW